MVAAVCRLLVALVACETSRSSLHRQAAQQRVEQHIAQLASDLGQAVVAQYPTEPFPSLVATAREQLHRVADGMESEDLAKLLRRYAEEAPPELIILRLPAVVALPQEEGGSSRFEPAALALKPVHEHLTRSSSTEEVIDKDGRRVVTTRRCSNGHCVESTRTYTSERAVPSSAEGAKSGELRGSRSQAAANVGEDAISGFATSADQLAKEMAGVERSFGADVFDGLFKDMFADPAELQKLAKSNSSETTQVTIANGERVIKKTSCHNNNCTSSVVRQEVKPHGRSASGNNATSVKNDTATSPF